MGQVGVQLVGKLGYYSLVKIRNVDDTAESGFSP